MHKILESGELWMPYAKVSPWAKFRLFCFPYAGSGSRIFRSWPLFLPKTIEVCPIELPGRGLRINERSFTELQQLIGAVEVALKNYLDKPFAFFGHSMGALISFELAHRIREKYGISPSHLFLSANPAPQIFRDEPPRYLLPEQDFIEELGRLNGMPAEIFENRELLQLILPAIRADFQVCETYVYQPRPPLHCPFTVFGGTKDQDVPHEDLVAWRKLTDSNFSLHLFPGDHFYLNTFQKSVLDILTREMNNYVPLK